MLNVVKKSFVVFLSLLVPLFFIDLSTAGKKNNEDKDNTILGVKFGNDSKSGDKGDSKSGDKGDDDDDSSNNPGGGGGKDDDKSGSVPASGGKGGGGKGGGGGTSAVPEPATVLLLGLGGAAIGIRKLMGKRKKQR